MGFFRFRKSVKILPGLKINFNKKGVSMTAGVRGMHCTIGKDKVHTTVGIPGTGLSYTTIQRFNPTNAQNTVYQQQGVPVRSPKVCPYCGHRMRKQWEFCPKCHGPLLLSPEQQQQLIAQQQAALVQQEEVSIPAPHQTTAAKGGCLTSCLLLLAMLALLSLI